MVWCGFYGPRRRVQRVCGGLHYIETTNNAHGRQHRHPTYILKLHRAQLADATQCIVCNVALKDNRHVHHFLGAEPPTTGGLPAIAVAGVHGSWRASWHTQSRWPVSDVVCLEGVIISSHLCAEFQSKRLSRKLIGQEPSCTGTRRPVFGDNSADITPHHPRLWVGIKATARSAAWWVVSLFGHLPSVHDGGEHALVAIQRLGVIIVITQHFVILCYHLCKQTAVASGHACGAVPYDSSPRHAGYPPHHHTHTHTRRCPNTRAGTRERLPRRAGSALSSPAPSCGSRWPPRCARTTHRAG